MKKAKQSGQAMVELAISLPCLILMVNACYDLGNLAWTAHKLHQAAYEAAKLVPEVKGKKGIDFDICRDGNNGKPCLDDAMVARTKEVLNNAGMKNRAKDFQFNTESFEYNGKTYYFLRVNVDYPYSFFGNVMMTQMLNIKAGAVVEIEQPGSNSSRAL